MLFIFYFVFVFKFGCSSFFCLFASKGISSKCSVFQSECGRGLGRVNAVGGCVFSSVCFFILYSFLSLFLGICCAFISMWNFKSKSLPLMVSYCLIRYNQLLFISMWLIYLIISTHFFGVP